MSSRFRFLPMLTALAVAAVSSAWAAEPVVSGEAARALQRAEGFMQQKQFKTAAVEFERASELAGGSCPECLLGVARAYSNAGQIDGALQVTRMALPLFSSPAGRARAYDQLGFLLTLAGEMDAARVAFGKAVALDGSMETQVRSSLAQALLRRTTAADASTAKAAGEQKAALAAGRPGAP